MSRLKSVRPDLDALMKEDPRAAKKKEPTVTGDAVPSRDRPESFAERIAARHETNGTEPRVRASKVAETLPEPDVLLLKAKRGR